MSRVENRLVQVYASPMLGNLSLMKVVDSPYMWGLVGLLVGLIFGVTTLSVWLLAIGLGVFLVYLGIHGRSQIRTEGRLFAAGPTYMMLWIAGFIIRAILFDN